MADNSKKTTKGEHLKPHQWKKGQSGNPGGRPKNPLKDFSLKEFKSWTDEEKKAFLEKIPSLDRWKMTEGNPKQDTDITSDGEQIQPILVEFINGKETTDNTDTE